jgi:hypothetical protein
MIHSTVRVFQFAGILGCLSSSIYYLLCLWSASTFLRQRKAGAGAHSTPDRPTLTLPPVSILKPLKGTDPDIYESFRSHCLQDYPAYEIIFGVSDADDPAVASVKQLQREFPEHAIQLIVSPDKLGANVKVSNLEQMLHAARYQHLLVNDSDIRVERDYLRRVIAPLADERIGMVTCLYRGIAASTSLWTRLNPGFPTNRSGANWGISLDCRLSRRRLRIGPSYRWSGTAGPALRRSCRDPSSGLRPARILCPSITLGSRRARFASRRLHWTSFDLRLDVGATRRDREPSRTLVVGVPGCDGSVAFGNGPCSRQVRTRRPPVAATVVASANSGSDGGRRVGREFRGSHSDLARRPIRTEEGAVDPPCTLVSAGKTS